MTNPSLSGRGARAARKRRRCPSCASGAAAEDDALGRSRAGRDHRHRLELGPPGRLFRAPRACPSVDLQREGDGRARRGPRRDRRACPSEGQERALAALRRFRLLIAPDGGRRKVRVVATAAVRDAAQRRGLPRPGPRDRLRPARCCPARRKRRWPAQACCRGHPGGRRHRRRSRRRQPRAGRDRTAARSGSGISLPLGVLRIAAPARPSSGARDAQTRR